MAFQLQRKTSMKFNPILAMKALSTSILYGPYQRGTLLPGIFCQYSGKSTFFPGTITGKWYQNFSRYFSDENKNTPGKSIFSRYSTLEKSQKCLIFSRYTWEYLDDTWKKGATLDHTVSIIPDQ